MKTLFTRILLPAFFAGLCFLVKAQSYTIPIVFHVLHQGGNENISDAQIADAMRILNEDYNKLNADTSDVIPYYKNNIADMQVAFRLANIDPQGNYTNGIDRIYSSLTNTGTESAKLHQWDRTRYLNIWTVARFTSGIAGYTYYPWDSTIATNPEVDGVMILSSYVGAIGTGNLYKGRALTNIIGRYLCLLRLTDFSAGACVDQDSVSDTPPLKSPGNCTDTVPSAYCTPGVPPIFQNFLAYCPTNARMFTNGQKTRVHYCLDTYRDSLSSPANLIATGTNYATPLPSAPIADFGVDKRFVCLGAPVVFKDASYNGKVDTRQWTFPNANIAISTHSSPVVVFNTLGWQTATLTVSNAVGNSSKTRSLVYVADPNAQLPVPYYNSFNDTADFAANWIPMNIDDDQASFQPISNGAFTNSMAIVLTNFNSEVDGGYDELITPAFDLSGLARPNDTLSFIYSYATQAGLTPPGPIDSLAVLVTTDCGTTLWKNIFKKAGAALMNGGYVSSYFIPTQSAYWSKVNIPINPIYRKTHTRFKLQIWGSKISNNFYLDDFSIGRTISGIDEYALQALSVVPNPFSSSVRINGLADGNYSISLYDVTGRQVANYTNIRTNNDQINLDLSDATTKGIYLLKITGVENSTRTLKLVRQ